MKLANYLKGKSITVGLVENGRVYPIGEAGGKTVDEILSSGAFKGRLNKKGAGIPVSAVKLTSPVLSPEKIICVAANYRQHTKESNVVPPPEPYLFTKFRNALIGPDEEIVLPSVSKKVDWEVELAVIIGREGKYISERNALDYVAGYTISNDISFRDFQKASGPPEKPNPYGQNWVLGKSMDAAFPLGPWLVTSDELSDPHKLKISLSVNGNLKQDSNTSEMIFGVERLVAHASTGLTLKPGDIISTGTPHGVGAATGGPFLKDGDIVECKIERIGTLRNKVKAEQGVTG